MSGAHAHDVTVPRGARLAAGAVVLVALLAAMAPRLGFAPAPVTPVVERGARGVPVVRARMLAFADGPAGEVIVRDARSGAVLAVQRPALDRGFVRGAMRAMARERRARGLGAEAPVRLELWADGALSLTDPATGFAIELGAFGPDNRAAFMVFLESARA